MARENLGDTFLRKLYEKTVNNEIETIDMYELGKEIGLLDKVQTYHLVDELIYQGYIRKKNGSKIYLSEKGRKRVEV
jgi:hypothetical protein